MLKAEDYLLDVVHTVHDELLIEADSLNDEELLKEIVLNPPTWAAGLPLDCESWSGSRYRK
jgi:hypothetical protein